MITKMKEEREVIMGLSMQTGYKKKGRTESKQLLCSHCGRFGYDDKGCLQLVGYPKWWGDPYTMKEPATEVPKNKGHVGEVGQCVQILYMSKLKHAVSKKDNPAVW